MRLGTESVGRLGLGILAVTGVIGIVLAVHGWSARSTGLPKTTLGTSGSTPTTSVPPTSPASSPSRPPGPTTPAGSPPATHRPLLSAQPYASAAYLIWPGTPSATAKAALTGLHVTVRQQGSVLIVSAGVNGQPAPAPQRFAGGARVYIVEQSFGDDSNNSDYNLGDDALVVTDANGGIIK